MVERSNRTEAAAEVGYKAEEWREKIKEEVLDILSIFHRSIGSIPYFIINGTLLGAVKFDPPGQIPWDDDADIGIFFSDVDTFEKTMTAAFSATPYKFIPAAYGYLIHGPSKGLVDFLVFDQHPMDGVYRMAYPLIADKPSFVMSQLRDYEFPAEELLPLRSYLFEDMVLKGPADGVNICKRAYGQDVFTVNKRPDGGRGIHPIWPNITRFTNPILSSATNFLSNHYPSFVTKIVDKRIIKKNARVSGISG